MGAVDRKLSSSIFKHLHYQPTLLSLPLAAAAAKSCPNLCDPIDGSPPGSPIPEILQARILEISIQKNLGDCNKICNVYKIQFSSVIQSCPTLSNPNRHQPVHHQLPKLTQTHVHQVGDAIQPSHTLLSPSLPTFNLPQH